MRYCNRHFEDLKTALQKKNLWSLVDTRKSVLKRRAYLWLHGNTSLDDYCPLVVSMLEISNKLRQEMMAYPHVQVSKSACPLCLVTHYFKPGTDTSWIDNCTDIIYIQALTNGLVKAA